LGSELSPAWMSDGRITMTTEKASKDLYQLAGRRINWDRTDYHPLLGQRARSKIKVDDPSMTMPSVGYEQATEIRESMDGDFLVVFSDVDARGGGASRRNTIASASSAVARKVATRPARPWEYQSSSRAAALPSACEAPGSWSVSPRRLAAAHRCTMPWWTTSSVTSQPEQVGTLAWSPAAAAASRKAAPLRTSAPRCCCRRRCVGMAAW
jgi:hypothetical protein